MEARYEVPLPYLDLSPAETYSQLLDSLEKLDEAAQSLFRNIGSRVKEDRGGRPGCQQRLSFTAPIPHHSRRLLLPQTVCKVSISAWRLPNRRLTRLQRGGKRWRSFSPKKRARCGLHPRPPFLAHHLHPYAAGHDRALGCKVPCPGKAGGLQELGDRAGAALWTVCSLQTCITLRRAWEPKHQGV